MPNGHVAEVEYLDFLRCKFISLHDQKSKMTLNTKGQKYPIYMFTAVPDLQISLKFSVRTIVSELQAILI